MNLESQEFFEYFRGGGTSLQEENSVFKYGNIGGRGGHLCPPISDDSDTGLISVMVFVFTIFFLKKCINHVAFSFETV